MKRLFSFLIVTVLFLQTGCALLPQRKKTLSQQASDAFYGMPSQQAPQPAPNKKSWLPHISFSLPFFHHRKPAPRAQALVKVGTIKTVSNDGSYVIAELEPGMMVPTGRELIVTAAAGDPIKLTVAENQPPYFIADVKNGHPAVGQTIFQ